VQTRLLLDERQIPTGERVRAAIAPGPLAERTFDDGFAEVADGTTFVVRGAGRTITVTFLEGYSFAQVYAPEGSDFICYEPMTAPTNALASGDSLTRVRPGDAYTAAFRIGVQ
jgi:galactose mutarotase-like enzyme